MLKNIPTGNDKEYGIPMSYQFNKTTIIPYDLSVKINFIERQDFLNAVTLRLTVGSLQDLAQFLQLLQSSIPDLVNIIFFCKKDNTVCVLLIVK